MLENGTFALDADELEDLLLELLEVLLLLLLPHAVSATASAHAVRDVYNQRLTLMLSPSRSATAPRTRSEPRHSVTPT